MTLDEKQDALDWLQDQEAPEADTALEIIDSAETRENTVLGMLMARRPHSEIRDYILGEQVTA